MIESIESMENDPFEVFLAIIPTVFLSFITVNLYPVFVKNNGWREKFVMDLITFITPLLLAVTILADHLLLLNITLVVICVAIGIKNKSGKVKRVKKDDTVIRSCITNLRSTTCILSIIAILAVDFSIFPSRFQKTEKYGFSLMDVGVGSFLISNAMVAPETRGIKTPWNKTLIGILILIALGLKRYFLLISFDYHVNVMEYGTHWNFFFTLAAAKMISAIMLATNNNINDMWTCGIKGLAMLIVHQASLCFSLESFVFSDMPRNNFFSANREGIVSSMGYAGLYLLEVAMSFQENKKSTFLSNSLILTGITFTLYMIFNVSRCVANITYCFWILLLNYVLKTLYYSAGEFMSRNYNGKIVPHTTFVFESINYNPLVFFMVANFMTGFVNLVFQTETVEPVGSLFILIVYLSLNCLFVSVMYVKKIKLKC